MLYIVSGRLNAEGFVFASLFDRPLVPPVVAVLWYPGDHPRATGIALCRAGFREFSLDIIRMARGVAQAAINSALIRFQSDTRTELELTNFNRSRVSVLDDRGCS